MEGLRQYFLIQKEGIFISMPSKVVDIAWHEFILDTRSYGEFCKYGAGRFIHHSPAELLSTKVQYQEGINNAWLRSCQRENIDPTAPERLPLLFALDAELDISDGFRYSLDYCAHQYIEHKRVEDANRQKESGAGGAGGAGGAAGGAAGGCGCGCGCGCGGCGSCCGGCCGGC